MDALLLRVQRAARARARAIETYREAVTAAARRHSYAEIAEVADVSRQGVWKVVRRQRREEAGDA